MLNPTSLPSIEKDAWYRLRRSAMREAAWHLAALVGLGCCLIEIWPGRVALQWLLQALILLGFAHFQLWRHLSRHQHLDGGGLHPKLGAANRITLARGWGVSCLAGLIFLPDPPCGFGADWIPGLLYLAIGCADLADGWVARRSRMVSELGRRLDMEMDALGLLAASALAVQMGRLPLFYLPVGLSYYLFRFGLWYRTRMGRPVVSLKHRPFARITAGFQMGFVGIALTPLFTAASLALAALFFALPLLCGFVWDWLFVSTRLPDAAAQRLQERLVDAFGILALIMRLVLLGCGLWGAGALLDLPAVVIGAAAVLWAMMVIGWLGRSAALAAACLLAYVTTATGPTAFFAVAMGAVLVLLIIGTGDYSLWKPEDALLSRKNLKQPTSEQILTP